MNSIQNQWLKDWDVVAVMKTSNWTIKIKLFTDLAPITTTNFIGLAKKWYYNWVTFHRVIKDFMIQWWDPDWTWMWGESIYWKEFEDEFTPELSNIKYSLSMANAWANTNWSQFFINQADNAFLNNKHSVFWQVVEWADNVDKIAKVQTWENDKPVKDVKIISIEIMQYNSWTYKDYTFDTQSKIQEIEKIRQQKNEAKKNKVIEVWDEVSVNYIWTYENWEKFDSSYDTGTPITFQVWAQQMIKWFDEWVIWMKIWEKKSLKLSPEQAYWEKEISIPKSTLQTFVDAWYKLEAWEVLPTNMWEIKILSADKENVTIENNHKMAWKTLNFDIEVTDIN